MIPLEKRREYLHWPFRRLLTIIMYIILAAGLSACDDAQYKKGFESGCNQCKEDGRESGFKAGYETGFSKGYFWASGQSPKPPALIFTIAAVIFLTKGLLTSIIALLAVLMAEKNESRRVGLAVFSLFCFITAYVLLETDIGQQAMSIFYRLSFIVNYSISGALLIAVVAAFLYGVHESIYHLCFKDGNFLHTRVATAAFSISAVMFGFLLTIQMSAFGTASPLTTDFAIAYMMGSLFFYQRILLRPSRSLTDI